MTGLVPDNLGKQYHTGAGGKSDAARAAVGLALWVGFMVWTWPSVLAPAQWGEIRDLLEALLVGVLVPIGLIAMIAYLIISERNARVIISDDGLLIQNWRKSRKLMLWDSIHWLTWYSYRLPYATYWLIPIVRNPRGRPSRKIIWVARRSQLGEVQELRDEILARCNLSESDEQVPRVLQTLTRLVGFRDFRFWRRHEVVE